MATSAAAGHLRTLDGLRTLAIALVLWQHTPILFTASGIDHDSWMWSRSLMAWWGVDLFFVLSGFLITGILRRTATAPRGLSVFWARRALRIFPLFYLYLAVTYLYGRFGGFAVEDEAWAYYLVHLANLKIATTDFGLPIFGVLWSLAVEEQFYAFYPLVVRRLTRRHLAFACLAVIAAAPFVRIALYQWTPLERHALHVLVFCRADTLAIGALIGLAWESDVARARLQRACRWALPFAVAVLASVFYFRFGHWVCPYEKTWTMIGYTSVGAACGVILVLVASAGPIASAVFGNPVTTYLGKISYGIYLWHCLVGSVVANLPGIESPAMRISLFLATTITVSALSFHLWETPFLRRKAAFAV